MLRPLLISLALLVCGGCATGAPVGGRSRMELARYRPFTPAALPREAAPSPLARPAPKPVPPGARDKVVQLAKGLVGQRQVVLAGHRYPDDCTGLVKGLFAQVGLDLTRDAVAGDNGVTAMYRFASSQGRIFEGGHPVPGDLVFFRDTYDLNRDGRTNDGLTHVGLVETVQDDGTVLVIHRVQRGVVRYRMNLNHKTARLDPATGQAINDYLRMPGPAKQDVLTGQLFAAYATVLPVEPRFARR